ncbi:MAG: amidohydrolase [Planctomycetota bacterium]|nr:MAG: amidohydrolase [Planctomycetota bacterium]
MHAELLLLEATLFCPLGGGPRPGAVAVRQGRIAAVGPSAALARELRGPGTRVVDCRGRLLTPGLYDAHLHLTEGGLSLLGVDCRVGGEQQLLERVRARAAALPPGSWITGRGWDERRLAEGRWPCTAALDAAAPGHPVVLRRVCGHVAVANRAALAAAGLLGPGAPDPPGGRLGRGPDGLPDGRLYETAIERVLAAAPPPSDAERLAGLRLCLEQARRLGLTSVEDERGEPELYLRLAAEGTLSCRVRIWNRLATPLEQLLEWRERFPREPRLRAGLLKGYLDGSLGARTAWFFEPYADAPASTGMPVLPREQLLPLAVAADRAGFQIGLHAIGDRAVATALDAYEAVQRASGRRGARHRVEHAQHVRPEDLPRFAALGVVASMQPSHLAGDYGMVRARLGERRLAGAYAWRSLVQSGAIVAFGSDFPIEPMDPRTSLHAALTRRPRPGAGGEIDPAAPLPPAAEAVDLATALRCFTLEAARAAFLEREQGALLPGQHADLVLWGEDLFRLPADALLEVPVDMTILGGRIVHARADTGLSPELPLPPPGAL